MSVFITCTDHALDRFTLPDGTEIAVGYDHDAEDTLENECELSKFIAAERMADRRNYISSGATHLISDYEDWHQQVGEYDYLREQGDITATEHDAEMKYLGACPVERHEHTAYDLYGHPTFVAYIDREGVQGIIGEGGDVDKVVQGVLHDYAHWAEGSVYAIEITHPDGETEFIGGITEDVTQESVARFL